MKKAIKVFIVFVVIGIITINTSLADDVFHTIKVIKNAIDFQINGEDVTLDNLVYDENVYIPVVLLENKLDLDVKWNKENNFVSIDNKSKTDSNEQQIEEVEKQIINVKTTEEFLKAIGPNRTIIIKGNDYDILEADFESEYVKKESVFDGEQLIIQNVSNMDIIGDEVNIVQLLVEPRYANVITFENVDNVNIDNVIAGHTPEKGECAGGVFCFIDSTNININDSILFGCGTEGVTLINVSNLSFNNSTIKECTNRIMYISDSKNIKFNNSMFYDNENYDLIVISDSEEVSFDECIIYNNRTYVGEDLFRVSPGTTISITNSKIINNEVLDFTWKEERIKLNNVIFIDNLFRVEEMENKDNAYEYMFNLSDEDIRNAMRRGKKIDEDRYTDYRLDRNLRDGYIRNGEDSYGNGHDVTYVDDVELITPSYYLESVAKNRYDGNRAFTFEEAKAIYHNILDKNELYINATILSENLDDFDHADAKLLQGGEIIDVNVATSNYYQETTYFRAPDVKYQSYITIYIDLDKLDLSEEAKLMIWPNGNAEHIGIYEIDFSKYK